MVFSTFDGLYDLAVLVLHRLAVLAQLGRAPLEHLAALHIGASVRT